jgi:heme O synthase-like polyprenyltransferase
MLPVIEPDGRRTGRQALFYSLALLPAGLMPTLTGVSGSVYFVIALLLGLALTWLAQRFAVLRSDESARALFFGSITYLPLLWIAMVVDKIW